MLDGLDDVPWAELGHGYGSAEDIPALLRALTSTERQECGDAIYELYGNLWHQGTVYEATAYAIPFLIELLDHPQVICKPAILVYLQALGSGSSYCDVHQSLWGPEQQESSEVQESTKRELGWVAAAHGAVLGGFDLYVSLLGRGDAAIRCDVPVVLTVCAERMPEVIHTLIRHLETESDELARASAVYALGLFVNEERGNVLPQLQAVFHDAIEPTVARVAAALWMFSDEDTDVDSMFEFLATTLPDIDKPLNQLSLLHTYGRGDGLIPEVSSKLAKNPAQRARWLATVLASEQAEVRETALWEVEEACLCSRLATGKLIPLVAARLKDDSETVRERAASVLGKLGREAIDAVDAVLPSSDVVARQIKQAVQKHQRECSAEHRLNQERARPKAWGTTKRLIARINRLFDSHKFDDGNTVSDVTLTLAARQKDRDLIAPVLRRLLRHDNQWVRARAVQSLWSMTEDADLVLPTIQQELKCRPAGYIVLSCLWQMGSAAASLVPTLQQMIQQDGRLPDGGLADTWIAEDEAFVDAIKQTLARIQTDQ